MTTTDHSFSLCTSAAMDFLGYSHSMIRERQKLYEVSPSSYSHHKANTQTDYPLKYFCTGSKAEGLSSLWENDVDCMVVLDDFICTNDGSKYTNDACMSVFAVEQEQATPGYTFLRLGELGEEHEHLVKFFINDDEPGKFYMPNYFLEEILKDLPFETDIVGPAINVPIKGLFPVDIVLALRCECPTIKQAFFNRERKYDQPSQNVLDEILKLETHVVAMGNRHSDDHVFDREWRICDTLSELCLMRNLNETQLHLYILLKMLAKDCLKEMGISTYILKNPVLWMTELYPHTLFERHLLSERVTHALELLRYCVKRRRLPNYMMPERNMFRGKFRGKRKGIVMQILTGMIDQGQAVVLKCPRMKDTLLAMRDHPDDVPLLGVPSMRDRVEIVFLMILRRDENLDNEAYCVLLYLVLGHRWTEIFTGNTLEETDYPSLFLRVFSSLKRFMLTGRMDSNLLDIPTQTQTRDREATSVRLRRLRKDHRWKRSVYQYRYPRAVHVNRCYNRGTSRKLYRMMYLWFHGKRTRHDGYQ